MRTQRYPSDLTDEQWALVEPLIPVYAGGRPRKTSMRDVLDAIFYLLRTGCQWRYLPKDCPPMEKMVSVHFLTRRLGAAGAAVTAEAAKMNWHYFSPIYPVPSRTRRG